jgi:hypothetical protein
MKDPVWAQVFGMWPFPAAITVNFQTLSGIIQAARLLLRKMY